MITNEVNTHEPKNDGYLLKSIKFKALITTLRAFMSPAETTKGFEITFTVDNESMIDILKEKLADYSLIIRSKAISFYTSDLAKTLKSISLLAEFLPKGLTEASLKQELTRLAETLSHNESVELIKDEQKLESITPSQIMSFITTIPKEELQQTKQTTITNDHYQPIEITQTPNNVYVVPQEMLQISTDQAIIHATKKPTQITKQLNLNENQKQQKIESNNDDMIIQDVDNSEDVIITDKQTTKKTSKKIVKKQTTTSIFQRLEITCTSIKRLEMISQHISPEFIPLSSNNPEEDFSNVFSSHPANPVPPVLSDEFGYQAPKQNDGELIIDSKTGIAEGVPKKLVETIINSKVEKTYDESAAEKANEERDEMLKTQNRILGKLVPT